MTDPAIVNANGDEGARLWPWMATCAVAAVLVDFGRFHDLHNGDSVLMALNSILHWTPFFWEQDRVGMLIPLLAVPLKHPLANLLFQNALHAFCGLAAFFLLPRVLVRHGSWPAAGALSAAAFLVLVPAQFRWTYLATMVPYAPSLFLGLLGLVAAEGVRLGAAKPWRGALALLIWTLAAWTNFAAFFMIAPLVLFRGGRRDRTTAGKPWTVRFLETENGMALAMLGASFVAGMVFKAVAAPRHRTQLQVLWPQDMPGSYWQLVRNTWLGLSPSWWPLFLALAAVAGALTLRAPALRERAKVALRASAALAGAAAIYCVFAGLLRRPSHYGFHYRYVLPSVLFVQAACVILMVEPLWEPVVRKGRRWVLAAMALLVPAAALVAYGIPSVARVRADLDRALGTRTPDVLEAGCTHVVGYAPEVWPTVFHVNMTLRDRGDDRIVWGVTYRSMATKHLWSRIPVESMRVAIPIGDRDAAHWAELLPPLVEVERRATVTIWRPR